MPANLEYIEYYLLDTGWVSGNTKFIGEKLQIAELPEDVKKCCYKHIRIVSEMRTVGSMDGARTVYVLFERPECEQKIASLLEKYPEKELF